MNKILMTLLALFSFQIASADDYTTACLKGKKHSTSCKRMLSNYWSYNALIEKIGREEGVDPSLLKAVIAYESSYNKNARSHANAKGLTQVIPGTARQHGVYNSQYLYIPEVSIRTGAKELAAQWRNFKRLDLTLAAYNAGSGAVKKYGYRVPPYKETTAYVKNISKLYYEFKLAEKNPPPPLATADSAPRNQIHHEDPVTHAAKNPPQETKTVATAKPKKRNKPIQVANSNGFKTVIAN